VAGAYALTIVCESPADRRTAADLADRVLCEHVDWLEPESLEFHRHWQGLEENSSHLEWHETARLRHVKAHGHFEGEPGAQDAFAARRALLLIATAPKRPDAVVLVRDTDGQEERRIGLEQARRVQEWPFAVLLAIARPKRESWALAGFEPKNQAEGERLEDIRRKLRFDPCLKPERLSAAKANYPRNAKRVLALLVDEEPEREWACWRETALDLLEKRGKLTGLADYLKEVRDKLIPLFLR
jgi:hypothetical protein